MKLLIYFFIFLCLTVVSCTSPKTVDVFEFNDSICNFDTIQAQKEEYCFHVTYYNHGNSPLYLTEVKPQCSCTTPEYENDALLPGDSAQIDIYFQSYLQSFDIMQTITVKYFYNDVENEKNIYLKGYVIPRVLDL